jgi:PAS domain S-box-containing protein
MDKGKKDNLITLFSETDPYGTITFANDTFCEVSKYRLEELIGKPHSIIRHPHMPVKLFGLLWETIKGGHVFRAVIKNLAKDKSPYWVRATIMPIHDGDNKIINYVGVRHLIEDTELAEKLYAQQAKELFL